MVKAKKSSRNPPIMEKLKSDLEARSLPRRQPPQTAIMPMRKVRTAVRGRENSKEAAPMPAAALSAERAKPRERASVGERMLTSSQLASWMVFFRELSKIFAAASTNNMTKDKKEAMEAGI